MFDTEVTEVEPAGRTADPAPKIALPKPLSKDGPGRDTAAPIRLAGLKLRTHLWLTGAFAIACLTAGAAILQPEFLAGRPYSTIAVLPVAATDASDDPLSAQTAESVSGRLVDGLAKIENLRVIAPSKNSAQAAFVVSSELQRNAESWIIRARLTETATGEVKWTASISTDSTGKDIQLQQSRLAAGLGHDLALRINELAQTRTRPPVTSGVKVVIEQAAAQINQTSPERFHIAVAMLEKALIDHPGDIDLEVALAAHMLRGVQMTWYNAADSAAAVKRAQLMLEHALRMAPNSISVHEAYCRLLSATNQFSASLVACARILTLDPWNGMALYLIGLGQVKLGRFEDALATFMQADQFDTPRVSRWTWTLGAAWAYMLMGKAEDALPWIQKSLAITSASGRSYFLQAAIYQQLGRLDEAKAAIAKGLATRPGSTAKNIGVPRENTSPVFMAAEDRLARLAVAAGLPEN
jgi:Tfp pilus assembly protein PilF/TolB-like protein